MLRTALRNVLAHKARLIMTALAVMLGVAFVSGTLVFGDTVASAYRAAATKNLKDVAVSVQAEYVPGSDAGEEKPGDDSRRTTRITDRLVQQVGALDGITSVRGIVNGKATLTQKNGDPYNAENTWMNLAANYVPGKGGKDSLYPLAQGRAPASADEMLLDTGTAERAGYRVGDTVRFATTGPAYAKKLVGLVSTEDPRITSGGSLALFDTKTAQDIFLSPGQYDEISVSTVPGTDQAALTNQIRALLPKEGATATSGAELAAAQSKSIAENTKFLTRLLLVFAGISLFVGVFIIANTFTMLIAQRTREIALMRAVGASRRQVVRSVLIEAGLLGLVASAAGFAIGLGIAAGLRPLLNASGAGLPEGPLVIGAAPLLWSLVVGVLITVLAAWLPSRKGAKVAPVEALSTMEAAAPARSMRVRNIVGGLITAAGFAVMLYCSTLKEADEGALYVAMFGSSLTLTGMIVLSPLLSRPLVTVAGRVTTRFFGASGKLAKENALRNPRRTAATASALMIGLTLITGMTVSAHSINVAMEVEAVKGLTADYKISNSVYENLEPELVEKIEAVPGVATTAPVASSSFSANDDFTMISGIDPRKLGAVANLDCVSGSAADLGPGKIAVSEQRSKKMRVSTGDQVKAVFNKMSEDDPGTEKQLTVVGVYKDNKVVDAALGTLTDTLPFVSDGKFDRILVKAAPGKADGLDRDLREALGNSPLLKVQDKKQITKEESSAVTLMLNMMYGLLGMAVVIAVLGVINTLAMSVFERTREIGMLRAIGMDRRGIKQMVRLESVVISLFAAALGIGTGIFLAWTGAGMAASGLRAYTTVLPWGRLALFAALALAIGVLAAIWPARRASRLNMLSSINAQ